MTVLYSLGRQQSLLYMRILLTFIQKFTSFKESVKVLVAVVPLTVSIGKMVLVMNLVSYE